MMRFRDKVLQECTCNFFDEPAGLVLSVAQDVHNWRSGVAAGSVTLRRVSPGLVTFVARGLSHTTKKMFLLKDEKSVKVSLPQNETAYTDFFITQGNRAVRFEFLQGKMPTGVESYSRPTGATLQRNEPNNVVKCEPDEPRFFEFAPGLHALMLEPQKTNEILHSVSPGLRDLMLSGGGYTLWCVGSGTVHASTGPKERLGTASEGVPLSFELTDTSHVRIQPEGDVRMLQLERGVGKTSFIPTGDAATTRAADHLVLSVAGGVAVVPY